MPAPRRQQGQPFRLEAYDRELLQAVNDRRLERDDPEAQTLLQQLETPWETEGRRQHSDIYLLSDEEQAQSDALLEPVYAKYPKMRQYGIRVKDSRHRYAHRDLDKAKKENISPDEIEWPGALEFYDPEETGPEWDPSKGERYQGNPYQGGPTIELFQPLAGKDVTNPIMGDMLHYLPAVDPEFAKLRQKFRRAITVKQKDRAREVWEKSGDQRSFSAWFETRLDAYIRGLLYPDERDDWGSKPGSPNSAYTKKLREVGEEIRRHVEGP